MVMMKCISVDALKPNARNARTHSKKQIRQIADSIEAFGFLVPILIDEAGLVIAGHGRYAAAKLLGLKQVPIIEVTVSRDNLDENGGGNQGLKRRPVARS